VKILVVGGAGYVGGALTDILAETSHQVRVYDSLLYEEGYRKPGDFVLGDVRDRARLLPHLKWADVVVWLAAFVGDGACALNPELSVEVNQESVRWLAANFDGRIVFTSTCSVYGARDGEIDESSPTGPLSVYGATKLAAEAFVQGRNAIIFRLGTLFGVGDTYSRIRLDLVVNALTVCAYREGKIQVFGGAQFRPLLHVRDCARAITAVLGTADTGIYNLARQNVRIIDLACQVRNHFPDVQIAATDMPVQDVRNYRVSTAKAKSELYFSALDSIDDGIDELRKLVVSGRLKDLDSPRYTTQKFLQLFPPQGARP
jgi:nucleoside-diphosphate-sugar epimerase